MNPLLVILIIIQILAIVCLFFNVFDDEKEEEV